MNMSILRELFANSNPPTRLLFALFIILISYFLITFCTILIVIPVYSISFKELNLLLSEGLSEADLSILQLFQISQTIGLFIVPAILLNYLLFKKGEGFISISTSAQSSYIGLIVLITLISSMPAIQFLLEWNSSLKFPEWLSLFENKLQQMESERNELTIRMTENMNISAYLLNLFMIAILPAIGEEFLFRGVIQKVLLQWTRKSHLSIFIAAVIFSGIHLQFYGFLPRLVLGIYFGYLFFWSKNVWLAVWAHFLNNAIAVSLIFYSTRGDIQGTDVLENYSNSGFLELTISIAISSLLLLFTHQYFKKGLEKQ